VNHEKLRIHLPKVVKQASKNLAGYFLEPKGTESRLDIIFQEIRQMNDYADFDLSLEIE
jgi:hypothetical protein